MSSFSTQATLQMPHFSSSARPRLWTHDCTLCLAPAGGELLCEACRVDVDPVGESCERCALRLDAPFVDCPACRHADFAFDRAVARFDYRFPLDRLVQRFKYGADLALGSSLARALADRLEREPRVDLLVVPPLSAARLRERGFNQALEIARVVGRRLGVPVAREAIVRTRETRAQAALGREARRANVRDAFACGAALEGLRVAIVDDVLTTGATMDAIAKVLKSAGAMHVAAWTLARAPDPGTSP
jgi:ComF family protein